MSASLVNIFASLPRTSRGTPIVLGSDPKGKNLLYVNGNSVFIRNIDNPFECDVYTEHSLPVTCAKYSPSGFYIASADQSGKVRIWDTVNKEHLLKNEFQPLSGCIKDLQWSSDNQRIIVGGEGREKFGHVFNSETGTSVGEIMGTSKSINSVDFKSSRPFRAVVASEDSCICFFEGPPFKFKKTMNEHDRFVNVIRYSPNGERFASGGADGKLIVFDGKTGDKLYELGKPAHNGGIYSISWDSTSQRLLSVSGDKTSKVWNVDAQSLVKEFHFGNSVEDQQVGSLWQGQNIISVSLSGNLNYLNLNDSDQQIIKTVKGHTKSVTALELVNQNGKTRLYSASHDGLVIVWNVDNGDMSAVHGNHHKNLVQALSYNKQNTIASCGFDDTVKFIDTSSNEFVDEVKMNSQPQGLAYLLDNTVVVACISELVILQNQRKVGSLTINYDATCISSRVDTNQIAVGGKDNKVRVYDVNVAQGTFNETKQLAERDFVTAVKYSNDGNYLAVADNNKNIRCYSINNNYDNITRDMWQHHAARITGLAWSPDSKHLASCGVDTHCMIYTPGEPQPKQIKNAHPLNPLTCVGWIDNSSLVTGSQDSCLRRWRINF